MLARHRDPEKALCIALVEVLRETMPFVAEDERVARLERAVVERARAVRRKEEETLRPLRAR